MEQQPINDLPLTEEAAPPVSGEPEQPVVETTQEAEGDASPPQVDEAPDPAKIAAEVEALEAKRRKAEEDAIYWRKQKAEARADYFRDKGREPEQPAQSQPEATEPHASDFDDYDQYVAALVDHRTQLARRQWEAEAARKEADTAAKERRENLGIKLQEGYQKYPDFEEVAFDRTASHITPMIVDILADCEHPDDVAYYLAKNRTEGVSISRMTPIQAARAIAKLEIQLSQNPQKQTPQNTKPITGAPPPIKPIGSGNAGISKDPEKMSQKEYNEWRKAQGARNY